ncbi:MAG: DNA methyltransferase [Armatimonadota bacterium]
MEDQAPAPPSPARRAPARRANDLSGAEWTRHSISVWSDLKKTPAETALKHPAMFPTSLVERVIRSFTREGDGPILDPFCGSGSTLVAAAGLGRTGVGFEVSEEYAELTERRLREIDPPASWTLHRESALHVPDRLAPGSAALCFTSPPYWDVLARKRTADYRDVRDYAGAEGDLSRVADYDEFVEALGRIFDGVYTVLRPGAYCVVNVMDLRKKDRFYPLHSDLAARLSNPDRGGRFIYDDLIVWDRRADYNSFRPLGYPAVFRINKAHEFLLIFRRPPGQV